MEYRTNKNLYNTRDYNQCIVVTNKHLDALLLKQFSDADAVVAEITVDGIELILASMYFDIARQIQVDLSKIEAVLQHANGLWVLLAIDGNARSALWNDPTTNSRGRTLDEYLMSEQLKILNEETSILHSGINVVLVILT